MSERGLGGLTRVKLRGYDAAAVSRDTATDTGPVTAVQQAFAEEVDINTIMRRFGVTREFPSGMRQGTYGDFTGVHDYQSALEAVQRAEQGFLALDPDLRAEFGNDPGAYLQHLESLSDEELAELEEPAPPAPEPATPPVPPAEP